MIGRVLKSCWRLERPLGEGGMGTVFAARHVRTGRSYAVKLLQRARLLDPQAVGRFRREAELLARLGHSGIVAVHDFDIDEDGTPFLVMDLCEGESLASRLARGPLAWPDALRIAREMAIALAAAHDAGVVHRDVKPANVFLARAPGAPERVVILDFGLGKMIRGDHVSSMTSAGELIGTPMYMSAEQARGEEIDARTDVYATAAVLYEMLAGRPPITSTSITDLILRVLDETPAPLSQAAPGCAPGALDDLLERSLAKQRDHRPPNMRAFLAGLDAVASAPTSPSVLAQSATMFASFATPPTRAPVSTTAPSSTAPQVAPVPPPGMVPAPASSRSAAGRWIVLAVGVSSLAAGGIGTALYLRNPSSPNAPAAAAVPAPTAIVVAPIPRPVIAVPVPVDASNAESATTGPLDELTAGEVSAYSQMGALIAAQNYVECLAMYQRFAPPRPLPVVQLGYICAVASRDVPSLEAICGELVTLYPASPSAQGCSGVVQSMRSVP